MRRTPLAVWFAAVVLVVAPAAATAGTPAPTDARTAAPTEIDSCTTITESGTYRLTADIRNSERDTCIEIRASDVTFVGAGHVVDGVRTTADVEAFTNATFTNGTVPFDRQWDEHGIAVVGPASNVTVRRVTVTDWFYGVVFLNASDGRAERVTARNNGDGIDVYNASRTTVSDVTATNNAAGIVFDNTSDGAVSNATANGNAIDGVQAFNSSDITVEGVSARDNTYEGVYVQESSDVSISDSTLANNSEAGVLLVDTTDSRVARTEVVGSGMAGIGLVNSTDNVLANNEIRNVRGTTSLGPVDSAAIGLLNSSDNRIRDTVARSNENWTYYSLNGSRDNVVENLSLESATVSFAGTDVAVRPVTAPPDAPAGVRPAGAYVWTDGTGPDAQMRISVAYDERGIPERDLRLWLYRGSWQRLAGSTVNVEQNYVTANLTRFGILAPMAGDHRAEDGEAGDGAGGNVTAPPGLPFVGTARDVDGDGLYEDVTGDGRLDVRDVAALAAVHAATQRIDLELSASQVTAFDFDGDGDFDGDDVLTLAGIVAERSG